jgi:hypothetical protein
MNSIHDDVGGDVDDYASSDVGNDVGHDVGDFIYNIKQ